jgi:hypothetical protein
MADLSEWALLLAAIQSTELPQSEIINQCLEDLVEAASLSADNIWDARHFNVVLKMLTVGESHH